MSELIGTFFCPQCLSSHWKVRDWSTYMSVVCATCGYKLGELFRQKEDDDETPHRHHRVQRGDHPS